MKTNNWDIFCMELAQKVAQEAKCLKRKVGAIIVNESYEILAMGYNSSPNGVQNCCDKGYCLRQNSKSGENLDMCLSTHAEINAILHCLKQRVNCEGLTMYVTTFPCTNCMKAIINSGIKEVVYLEDYNAPLSKQLASQSGVKIRGIKL